MEEQITIVMEGCEPTKPTGEAGGSSSLLEMGRLRLAARDKRQMFTKKAE